MKSRLLLFTFLLTNICFYAQNTFTEHLINQPLSSPVQVQSADIDGDGDFDMFIGIENGTIMYYSNTGSNKVAQYSFIKEDWENIRVNTVATPSFYDIDKDKDMDLVIGQGDGHISYYKNTGTIQVASMTFITDSLGKMKTAPYIKQGPTYVLSSLGSGLFSINVELRKRNRWQ